LTFTKKTDILFAVMRNLYKKNQMTLAEIRRFTDDKRKREAHIERFYGKENHAPKRRAL
jgi:hypothetical protein